METSWLPLPHPLYPLPTREQYDEDPDKVRAYLEIRQERIALEDSDPYRYGFIPEVWQLVDNAIKDGKKEILILGGNRSSKSCCCSRKVIETLLSGPKKTVWCLQSTFDNSIEMQQNLVYHYLPIELKNAKKGRVVNISYTQKMGFAMQKFIMPNGSECLFRHYSQNEKTIEGGNCDLIWADEMVPLNWIETLRYRLVTRAGLLLISFTPIQGWTPAVKEYLDGAVTLQRIHAPLLSKGAYGRAGQMVPRIQQPQRQNARIIYFHSSDNPFGGYETMVQTLEGASREEILVRAYGIPTKSSVARFPKFRDSVHVIPEEQIPKKGTRYHIVDPATGKNWFMLWVLVDEQGIHYIYREWPCPNQYIPSVGDPGDWAETDGRLSDGRQGPAQLSYGWGLTRYKEEIDRLEVNEPEPIAQRWMDSRFGAIPSLTADSATTLLEECANLGLYFHPAPLDPIEEGVQLINSMFDFSEDSEGVLGSPRLMISTSCRNLIFALKVWTGKDGKAGATKDPIDCLRYAVLANLVDYDSKELTIVEGGSY
jgi:hypothetical protein